MGLSRLAVLVLPGQLKLKIIYLANNIPLKENFFFSFCLLFEWLKI